MSVRFSVGDEYGSKNVCMGVKIMYMSIKNVYVNKNYVCGSRSAVCEFSHNVGLSVVK